MGRRVTSLPGGSGNMEDGRQSIVRGMNMDILEGLEFVRAFRATDGASFEVGRDEDKRYVVHARFPYITGSQTKLNNFINYARNEIKDESTAVGMASFACDCYERSLRHYRN